ncbi:MAG TPA: hypothetical protein VFT22_25410 [Kofleriaceae bacterium]|nr:hypothetical protein [Kofleriaceae bacterium]
MADPVEAPEAVDSVDGALRRAMAALDDQVPAGTFESFVDRTLARLDAPVADRPVRARRGGRLAAIGVVIVVAAGAMVFVAVTARGRLAGAPAAMQDTAPAVVAPRPAGGARARLSSEDIERGMTGIRARARACAHDTARRVPLEVDVRPSGQVERVVVSGPLTGTTAGACVEAAVRAARFPAWSGPAQRFTYELPLSE